jgi:Ca2+-binding EF-hand superfamily protein
VNIVDKDGTGNIDFPEFLSMMAIKVLHSFSLETVSFSVQL